MFWAGITHHSKTKLILLKYPPPKLNPRTKRMRRGGFTSEAYAEQVLKGPHVISGLGKSRRGVKRIMW